MQAERRGAVLAIDVRLVDALLLDHLLLQALHAFVAFILDLGEQHGQLEL